MTELETEPSRPCPACGSESVQRVRDGERSRAPHVRDEYHPPDHRCLSCGERWNPVNRPPEASRLTRAFLKVLAVLGFLIIAAFTLGIAAVTYLIQRGERPAGVPRDEWSEFIQDPIGALASELMDVLFSSMFAETAAVIVTAWAVIPVTPLLIGGYLFWKRKRTGELETELDRGDEQ